MGHRRRTRIALGFGALVALAFATPARAGDEEGPGSTPASTPAGAVAAPGPVEPSTAAAPTAPGPAPGAGVKSTVLNDIEVDYNEPDPNRRWDAYLRAFLGGVFINYVVWQFDWFRGETFHVTRESIGNNFKTGFVFDDNKFKTNFFGHPYHGSMYYGAARGAGLSYWESLAFPWMNSFMWEFMGERHFAAPNDWIMTSYGGGIIGEALFRLANEVLDQSATGRDRAWSETGTMAVSPLYGFQRLASGRTTEPGPKPKRHPIRVDLNAGIDRFQTRNVEDPSSYDPTLLLAADVEYGDLLPPKGRSHVEAFEDFDLYVAAQIGNKSVSGGQLWVQGIAYGWNSYLSDPNEPNPDNNIFAIVQSFDFQGANIAQFGGTGLGIANYTKWRFSSHDSLRLEADLQGSLLSGATSPFTGDTGRTYNFSVGGTLGLQVRWETKKYGELGLRGKQYYQRTVNGEDGTEFIGYLRAWYEYAFGGSMGIGLATTFTNRKANYNLSQYAMLPSACDAGSDLANCKVSATGLSWQLYFMLLNQ